MQTHTAVIATEAGGVITEIVITALGAEHEVAAVALLSRLIEASRTITAAANEPEPVIGTRQGVSTLGVRV